MTPLSEKDKAELQRKFRAKKVLELCSVMMVSDRVAHDLELLKIYEFLYEDPYFKDIDLDGEGLQEMIREIQRERVSLGLNELIKKYSAVKDIETRERAKMYMTKIIPADKFTHDKEIEALKILEDTWKS